jgi:hypothetical protein
MALRKNKAFALLSVIVAATVFGVLVFSVAASEDVTVEEEETAPVFWGFRNRWLDTLTDDQLATLKEMIEENRAEVKDQLEEGGIEIPEVPVPRACDIGFRGRDIRGFGLFKP